MLAYAMGLGIVAPEELNVLAHAEHLRGFSTLQHDSRTHACGMIARVGAKDIDGAGCWRTEPHEKLDRSGLSGSVGTK